MLGLQKEQYIGTKFSGLEQEEVTGTGVCVTRAGGWECVYVRAQYWGIIILREGVIF